MRIQNGLKKRTKHYVFLLTTLTKTQVDIEYHKNEAETLIMQDFEHLGKGGNTSIGFMIVISEITLGLTKKHVTLGLFYWRVRIT